MTEIVLKNNFHTLIDSITNKGVLEKFYGILENASNLKDGELCNKLSENQKSKLLEINKDVIDSQNLISHQAMQQKHKKWL